MRDQPDEHNKLESVRAGRWKLIGQQLYDLRNDPEERGEALLNRPQVYEELQAILEDATEGRLHSAEELTLDAKTEKRLEALGYL